MYIAERCGVEVEVEGDHIVSVREVAVDESLHLIGPPLVDLY